MSANKAKGTRWETALVRSLADFFGGAFGLAPRRVVQEGYTDSGDLHGVSPFIVQAKDWRSWDAAIREGLDGAERQKGHAAEPYGVALVKRARRGVGDGYAVMTVATFARVLLRLRRAEALLAASGPSEAASHAESTLRDASREFRSLR